LDTVVDVHDEWINTVGVHPDAELTLKTGSLAGEEGFIEGGLFGFGQSLETWAGVEEVGDEGKVKLGVTFADFVGGDEFAAVDLGGFLEHLLGTLVEIFFVQWGG
jgi:hypothetical protein